MATTIVIGAGQAGAEVASRLRDEGYEGRIILVGQENYMPYQRPPLSKKVTSSPINLIENALLDKDELFPVDP
ncbi:MAG: hypothetical protein EBW35_12965 [Rhodobacterales bacterium]|nr:hypothetical protein [Rhodobacterales bacterium]